MRRILVEKARQKQRIRHGGEFRRITFNLDAASEEPESEQLLVLPEALERLEQLDPDRAQVRPT